MCQNANCWHITLYGAKNVPRHLFVIDRVREHSQNLFNTLTHAWGCNCSIWHCASLSVAEWALDEVHDDVPGQINYEFHMWLTIGDRRGAGPKEGLWDCHDVSVRVLT